MSRFSDFVGNSNSNFEKVEEFDAIENQIDSKEEPESTFVNKFSNVELFRKSEQASSIEEALQKNILFSRNLKIEKEEESKPKPAPKTLNPGHKLFRYKLTQQPKLSNNFTENPSIKATKPTEKPFVAVDYQKPKKLRNTMPVDEVAQEASQEGQETL
jgi:hypothetical protein